MGQFKRFYINNDIVKVYKALVNNYFMNGHDVQVEIDIDWDRIAHVYGPYGSEEALDGQYPDGGSEDSVYIVGSGNPYYAYLWDGGNFVKTKTYATASGNITTSTRLATVTFRDLSDPSKVFFELLKTDVASGSSNYMYKWTTYGSDSKVTNYLGTTTYSASCTYLYSCENGIIVQITQPTSNTNITALASIRIVATNDDYVAFLSPTTSGSITYTDLTPGVSKNIRCLCYGDVTPYSTFTMSMRNDTHYQVVPMLTNSPASVARYTEKSGFLTNAPSAARGQIKRVAINGKTYLTDGYFAIEDGEIDG